MGPTALGLVRMGIGLVEVQSVNLLRTVAFSEIFLFPLLILSLFRCIYYIFIDNKTSLIKPENFSMAITADGLR